MSIAEMAAARARDSAERREAAARDMPAEGEVVTIATKRGLAQVRVIRVRKTVMVVESTDGSGRRRKVGLTQIRRGGAPLSRRRHRDPKFAELVATLNVPRAPVLNVEVAAAMAADEKPVDAHRFVISERKVRLTRAWARRYVELPAVKGERDVSDSWAQHVLVEILARRFNWTNFELATCELDGATYKINAQHTCWAWLASDRPDAEAPLIRHVHYRVDTEQQLRAIYSTYDIGKNRPWTHRQVVALYGLVLPDTVSVSVAKNVAAGLSEWRYPQRGANRKSPDWLAEIIATDETIRPLFLAISEQATGFDREARKVAMRAPVLAAMFETFAVDAKVATGFWGDVANGTNLAKGDVRWHLHRFLASSVLNSYSRNSDRKAISNDDMYNVCVGLWNKWRRGETVGAIRTPAHRPKAI